MALAVWQTATAADLSPQQRLARRLARAAGTAVETPPLTVEAMEGAVVILREAVALDPDNAELWRVLLKLAALSEREDVESEAVGQLMRLDPDDDVVRLRYINGIIERYQTVEERLKAYQVLLAPENRSRLGSPALASRLAEDLAVLLDRSGDVEGFAHWLAEAVAIDPANRSAAATAAGFFRASVSDDYAEAELLIAAILADPTAYDTQVLLGQLLLNNGAYVGADRIYGLAAATHSMTGMAPRSGMLADRAVAQWGRGDADAALEGVRRRQREYDEQYRWQMRSQQPDLTPLDLARMHAPIVGTLATVRAAIHNRRGDEEAGPSLASAIASYESEIKQLRSEENPDLDEIAERYLQMAWIALWLGGEIDQATGFMGAAEQEIGRDGISDTARRRFDGWMALRRDDPGRAIELLGPMAEGDPVAALGQALAQRQNGQKRTAARLLWDIAAGNPGTLLGVWAADLLKEMLGRPLPVSGEAARLEELVNSIPSIVFRLPDEPTLALSVRLVPAKTTFSPFEPVILNIEVTNNAPFPLAIDPRGPIRPQIVVIITAGVSRQQDIGELRPIIVDLDRRLRLEPGDRLVIPVDLRQSVLAHVMSIVPLRGAVLQVRAVSNFGLTGEQVIRAGVLGSEVHAPPIRIDGHRVTSRWVAEAIADIVAMDSAEDLITAGLLGHLITNLERDTGSSIFAGSSRAEVRQLSADAASAITEAYGRMDEPSRAWLLAVLPRDGPFDTLHAMAQKDSSRLVRMTYLLFCLTGPKDPMIDAAKRGDDQVVRGVADLVEFGMSRVQIPEQ